MWLSVSTFSTNTKFYLKSIDQVFGPLLDRWLPGESRCHPSSGILCFHISVFPQKARDPDRAGDPEEVSERGSEPRVGQSSP